MNIDVQMKIRNDEKLRMFLRENSYWYKLLNRDSNNFNYFVKDMKEKYKLNPTDRFTKMIDNIDMLQKFLNVIQ